jgi:Putative prokaryotic signal transducing protein
MPLVRVFSPQSESEKAVAISLLEAHEIPVFVHGGHLGSLLPGLQINAYNTQSLMVPEERVSDAVELLAALRRDSPTAAIPSLSWGDRLRVVLEGVLFGWLIPAGRARKGKSPEEADDA